MGAAASTNANAFLASAAPEDGALAAIQAMGAMEDELLATHYPVETVGCCG